MWKPLFNKLLFLFCTLFDTQGKRTEKRRFATKNHSFEKGEKGKKMNTIPSSVSNFFTFVVACIAFIVCTNAAADTPSTDPEILKAQAEQALAQAKQAAAEADLAAAKARLGQLTVALPKGTISPTKLDIEGNILAYRAAAQAAVAIVNDVVAASPAQRKIVLYSGKELNTLLVYQAFKAQAELLLSRVPALTTMPTLITDKPLAPCPKLPEKRVAPPLFAIDTALQLLGLFKTERTITGQDITLDDFAVVSSIAAELKKKGISVGYPPSYYPNALNPSPANLAVYATFRSLSQKQLELGQFAAQVDARKQDLGVRASNDPKCKDVYATDIATLDAHKAQVIATAALLGQIVATLTAPDAQSGLSLIQSLSTAEQLARDFASASILQVKAIAAGGSTQTTTNIFGSKLSFSGGVVISYMLLDTTGAVLAAGTVPVYGGYINEENMK